MVWVLIIHANIRAMVNYKDGVDFPAGGPQYVVGAVFFFLYNNNDSVKIPKDFD